MGSKGARRRLKQKRKELANEIDDFVNSRNQHSTKELSEARDNDLFSVDKVIAPYFFHQLVVASMGQSGLKSNITSATTISETRRPPVRQLTPSKKGGITKKIKPRSKAKLSAQKAEKFFDIWAVDTERGQKQECDLDVPTIWKGDRIPRPGKGPRPNMLAVSVDEPGCSFNPDPVQHQAALRKKEIVMQKTKQPTDVTAEDVLQQEQLFDELDLINIGEGPSSDDEEEEPGIIYRPKIPEKKTRTQRNKEKRHKEYLKAIENRKKLKKFHAQINNIKEIDRNITKQLKQSHLKNLKRIEKRKIRDRRGLHRLGSKKLRDAAVEVQSTDAASVPCLRKLRVSNDLALHRYISLQKRGKIETGRFRGRKNRKKCTYHSIGLQRRRLAEAKKDTPVLQKRVQELHDQLHQIKLSESAT